ncbi:MAG: cytochrome P460 family protein [Gammaproteobacteria bacterium]
MNAGFLLRRTVAVTIGVCSVLVAANAQAPFGSEASVSFAKSLWEALTEARLVGEDVVRSHAWPCNEPHGAVLEQTETRLTVDGRTGTVIVKHNYMRPDGELTTGEVMDSGWSDNLVAVTVMFKRESGYNSGAGDWFWAKYLADGSLDRTPQGTSMAGRVQGCIQCHSDADGDDYVFMHNRYSN